MSPRSPAAAVLIARESNAPLNRQARLGIGDGDGHLVEQALEHVRSAQVEEAAIVHVAVQVGHCPGAELIGMLLGPLR